MSLSRLDTLAIFAEVRSLEECGLRWQLRMRGRWRLRTILLWRRFGDGEQRKRDSL
jgi:hypothetical protein